MVIWSESAKADLRSIHDFIAHDSGHYAKKVAQNIVEKTDVLNDLPRIGRIVPELGNELIREIILTPYRIVYELDDSTEEIAVIRIWHGARGEPEI